MNTSVPTPTLSLAALILVLFPLATAAEDFPAVVEEADTTLERNGVGLCEWCVLEIDIDRAALWLEVRCSDPQRILEADAAKRIDLLFCRKLSQEQMRKAYRSSFDVNATDEKKEEHGETMARFVAWLGEAPKGSRLSIVHVPGSGVEFRQRERVLASEGGDAFARLMFRLSLGERPPTNQLRRQMPGKHACPEVLRKPRPTEECAEKAEREPDAGETDDESEDGGVDDAPRALAPVRA